MPQPIITAQFKTNCRPTITANFQTNFQPIFGQFQGKFLGPKVVSIGRLTAFYVVLVPMEYIPSKPPHSAYVTVLLMYLQKGSTF